MIQRILRIFRDRFSPKRVFGLIRKEVAVLLNDKPAMVIIFAIPIIVVLLINMGNDNQIMENPQLGIIDLDNSMGYPDIDISKELVKVAIEADLNDSVDLIISDNETFLNEQLSNGKIAAYIIIPEGFEYNLSIHFPSIIVVRIDGMNILQFMNANQEIDNIIATFRQRYDLTGVFQPDVTRVNRPEDASRLFSIAPFFFPWTLFSIATLIASQCIVSDIPKHRMALTPSNKFEISIGKIGGIQTLMSVLCVVLIVMSMTVGGMVIRSSLLEYYLMLWITTLAGVTLGFVLSALAKTPLAALQFFIFFFLLQAIVIFFIPWEDLLLIFPVYNAQFLIQNIVIRGMPILSDQVIYLNSILLFIGITYLIGYFLYRRIPTIV